jgi:hypothetical protein
MLFNLYLAYRSSTFTKRTSATENTQLAPTFSHQGQDHDTLFLARDDGMEEVAERPQQPDAKRTRVWYVPI